MSDPSSTDPGGTPPGKTPGEAGWYDLFSRGARDWLRHNEKVRDAVRQHLPQIVAGADVLTGGASTVRVPVRMLEHYRFKLRPPNEQEGVGHYHVTIRNGRRCSASVAFLHPLRDTRANLTVLTGAHATGLILHGNEAQGVKVRMNGREVELRARRVSEPSPRMVGLIDKLAPTRLP